jgi:hypothetical protein
VAKEVKNEEEEVKQEEIKQEEVKIEEIKTEEVPKVKEITEVQAKETEQES